MGRIATYVFLDLETTGVPQSELNKTRITELSMVAVKTSHLLVTRPGMTPRVQNKLTLCFNPRRMIEPGCTEVTGLCNDLLEHETSFNMKTFSIINTFIEVLTPPVCLIAHNGYGFDYPILKKQLVDLGVSFAEDLLCADSFHIFYNIMENNGTTEGDLKTVEAWQPTEASKINDKDSEINLKEMQLKNETSPKQSIIKTTPETPRKKPQSKMVASKARRKFPWSSGEKPKASYRLQHVHERLLNRPAENTHRAEGDCILLLESVGAIANKFVEWTDDENNHKKFSEIKPMTLGVPLGE